jgi:hypothetical protein
MPAQSDPVAVPNRNVEYRLSVFGLTDLQVGRAEGGLDVIALRIDEYQPMGLPLYLPAQDQGHLTTRIIDVRCENPIPDDAPELTPFEDILWKSMLKMSSVPLRSRIYVRLLFKKTSEAIFHRTALILKMLSNLQ